MPTEAMVLKTFDNVKMADLKPYEEKAAIKNLVNLSNLRVKLLQLKLMQN